jgi:hypothetical protein
MAGRGGREEEEEGGGGALDVGEGEGEGPSKGSVELSVAFKRLESASFFVVSSKASYCHIGRSTQG